jgi:hypothetical protein
MLQSLSPLEKRKYIIVMSDGEANVGCTGDNDNNDEDKREAIDAACNASFILLNLTIHSIGFGDDAEGATLLEIAKCGGGEYHHVSDPNKLTDIYLSIAEQIKVTHYSLQRIDYLAVIFYDGVNSYKRIITEPELPEVLGTQRYNFNFEETGLDVSNIERIEIYAFIVDPSGTEIASPLYSVWEKRV